MHKNLWIRELRKNNIPAFPCPACGVGHLTLREGDLHFKRPGYQTFEDYEKDPEKSEERFVMFLTCTRDRCGEVIAVSGDVAVKVAEDTDGNETIIERLRPYMMSPFAPPIISMHDNVPDEVREEIERSFQLFWFRYAICASRLRTSIERLMDHFGVARFRIAYDSRRPNAPGKRVPFDLSARIDKLGQKIGTTVYSELLHALRVVGNLGTHGSSLNRATILDAYTLYERALQDLFQDKSERPEAIIKRLESRKR